MRPIRWTTRLGAALWLGVPVVAWLVYAWTGPHPTWTQGWYRLTSQWQQRSTQIEAETADGLSLLYRDPVFMELDGRMQRVGHVVSPTRLGMPVGSAVRVEFYRDDLDWQAGELELHRPTRSLARVVQVMMTPERIERLKEILLVVRQRHEAEMIEELTPIVKQAFEELRPIIETDLRAAIVSHRPQLEQLSDRYQSQIAEQRLVPLVRSDILPVVQKHATPLLEDIGSELWQRVSLWRFAWRYVYDGSVGPSEPLVKREWDRFVRQQAMPLLQSRSPDFLEVQTKIIKELADNPAVTAAIRESLGEVMDDPAVWQVTRSIVAEAITQNPRVENALRQILQSSQTQERLSRLGGRIEPYAVMIGQELFGSPQEVNEEFALVLRHMILQKDEQWLVWRPISRESDDSSSLGAPVGTSPKLMLRRATELGKPPFFMQSPADRFELHGGSISVGGDDGP